MVQYGTAAQARQRAHNMGTNFYSDAEVDAILVQYSNNLHLLLGRALTGADYSASDVEFSTAQIYAINATACQMLASVEIEGDNGDECGKTAQKALDALQDGGAQFAIVTGHYEINDGLDDDLYSQRDP